MNGGHFGERAAFLHGDSARRMGGLKFGIRGEGKWGVLVSDSTSDIILSSDNLKRSLCGRVCRSDDETLVMIWSGCYITSTFNCDR